jgi:hypothetical protein
MAQDLFQTNKQCSRNCLNQINCTLSYDYYHNLKLSVTLLWYILRLKDYQWLIKASTFAATATKHVWAAGTPVLSQRTSLQKVNSPITGELRSFVTVFFNVVPWRIDCSKRLLPSSLECTVCGAPFPNIGVGGPGGGGGGGNGILLIPPHPLSRPILTYKMKHIKCIKFYWMTSS